MTTIVLLNRLKAWVAYYQWKSRQEYPEYEGTKAEFNSAYLQLTRWMEKFCANKITEVQLKETFPGQINSDPPHYG